MAKQTTRQNTKSNSNTDTSGRTRAMAPKAGLTKNRTRYGNGGKTNY